MRAASRPEPRVAKNRMNLDIDTPRVEADAELLA